MVKLNQASSGDKNKIYALVTTLTDLNPNAIEISSPIEASNNLLKELTKEIDQLNTKDKLLKLAHLAVLEERLPKLKNEINVFIVKLLAGKDETEKLCLDYERVIESLDKEAKLLNDNDPVKVDALGIVSINNLKLKNFKNQVHSAVSQMETLEKFKTITLYHLSDTINNNKDDKDSPIINEIRRVMSKLEDKQKMSKTSFFIMLILAGYNYVADHYHITYQSSKKIAHQVSNNSSEVFSTFSPAMNMIQTFGGVISTVLMIAVGFNVVFSRSTSSIFLIIPVAAFGMLTMILPSFFGVDESNVTYTEKTIQVVYDFYNTGATGTLIMLAFALLFGLNSYFKYRDIKLYTNVAKKLENNNAGVKNEAI